MQEKDSFGLPLIPVEQIPKTESFELGTIIKLTPTDANTIEAETTDIPTIEQINAVLDTIIEAQGWGSLSRSAADVRRLQGTIGNTLDLNHLLSGTITISDIQPEACVVDGALLVRATTNNTSHATIIFTLQISLDEQNCVAYNVTHRHETIQHITPPATPEIEPEDPNSVATDTSAKTKSVLGKFSLRKLRFGGTGKRLE